MNGWLRSLLWVGGISIVGVMVGKVPVASRTVRSAPSSVPASVSGTHSSKPISVGNSSFSSFEKKVRTILGSYVQKQGPYFVVTTPLITEIMNATGITEKRARFTLAQLTTPLEKVVACTRAGMSSNGTWVTGLQELYFQFGRGALEHMTQQFFARQSMQLGIAFLVSDAAVHEFNQFLRNKKIASVVSTFHWHIVRLTTRIAQKKRLSFDQLYKYCTYTEQMARAGFKSLLTDPLLYGPSMAQIAACGCAINEEISAVVASTVASIQLSPGFPVYMVNGRGIIQPTVTSLFGVIFEQGAVQSARIIVTAHKNAPEAVSSALYTSTASIGEYAAFMRSSFQWSPQQDIARLIAPQAKKDAEYAQYLPFDDFTWHPTDNYQTLYDAFSEMDAQWTQTSFNPRFLQTVDYTVSRLSNKISHNAPLSVEDVYQLRGTLANIDKLPNNEIKKRMYAQYQQEVTRITATALEQNISGVSNLVKAITAHGVAPTQAITVSTIDQDGHESLKTTSLLELALDAGNIEAAQILLAAQTIPASSEQQKESPAVSESTAETELPESSESKSTVSLEEFFAPKESKAEHSAAQQKQPELPVALEQKAQEVLRNEDASNDQKKVAQLVLEQASKKEKKKKEITPPRVAPIIVPEKLPESLREYSVQVPEARAEQLPVPAPSQKLPLTPFAGLSATFEPEQKQQQPSTTAVESAAQRLQKLERALSKERDIVEEEEKEVEEEQEQKEQDRPLSVEVSPSRGIVSSGTRAHSSSERTSSGSATQKESDLVTKQPSEPAQQYSPAVQALQGSGRVGKLLFWAGKRTGLFAPVQSEQEQASSEQLQKDTQPKKRAPLYEEKESD